LLPRLGALFASISVGIAAWPNFDTATGRAETADQSRFEAKHWARQRGDKA